MFQYTKVSWHSVTLLTNLIRFDEMLSSVDVLQEIMKRVAMVMTQCLEHRLYILRCCVCCVGLMCFHGNTSSPPFKLSLIYVYLSYHLLLFMPSGSDLLWWL